MKLLHRLAAALAVLALAASSALAASLQVSPVRLTLPPGANATTLNLTNTGSEPVSAQVRVFRWVQENGEDRLIPTRDAVASPPILDLQPGRTNVVRIVRTVKTPVAAEEAYRLLVDQLPSRGQDAGFAVHFRIRYSVPVFFPGPARGRPQLQWSVTRSKAGTVLDVANTGDGYQRLSQLSLALPGGKTLPLAQGLAGYVLANSTARFTFAGATGVKRGQTVTILAQGNDVAIQAAAQVR